MCHWAVLSSPGNWCSVTMLFGTPVWTSNINVHRMQKEESIQKHWSRSRVPSRNLSYSRIRWAILTSDHAKMKGEASKLRGNVTNHNAVVTFAVWYT